MLKSIFVSIILLLILSACSPKETADNKSNQSDNKLTILTLDEIKSSGFLKRITVVFETENKCTVEIISVTDSKVLSDQLRSDRQMAGIDLVLGINNCFLNPDDYSRFLPNSVMQKHPVSKAYQIDSHNRIIPYGFGYLALLYNENLVEVPPETLGSLQDSRFSNRMVLTDPLYSGPGRAVLYWTVSLFGDEGHQLFWKSIKKNVKNVKESYRQALQMLQIEESAMTFGFTNTPAWLSENYTDLPPIKALMMQEGSFLYIEAAAIAQQANDKELADKFLQYLLSPEVQKFVAYDLGMFPANESAPLPEQFLAASYSANVVNDKLNWKDVAFNLERWLDIFNKLFSTRIF